MISCVSNEEVEQVETENILSGRWELITMEYKDSTDNWNPYMGGMNGELLYHPDGFMTLHLIPNNYPRPKDDFSNFDSTQAVNALKHLANFYSYSGDYELLNDSVVFHAKRIHSNPSEWGSTGERIFWFKGDTLCMRPAEERLSHIRMKWIKSRVRVK